MMTHSMRMTTRRKEWLANCARFVSDTSRTTRRASTGFPREFPAAATRYVLAAPRKTSARNRICSPLPALPLRREGVLAAAQLHPDRRAGQSEGLAQAVHEVTAIVLWQALSAGAEDDEGGGA